MTPYQCSTIINQGKNLVPIATPAVLPNWLQSGEKRSGGGGGGVLRGGEGVSECVCAAIDVGRNLAVYS